MKCITTDFQSPSKADFVTCSAKDEIVAEKVPRTDGELIDCELAMAWQLEPWSENSAINRCTKILEDSNITKLMYGDKIPFGLNLQPDEVWITSPSDSLIEKISKLGITVKYFGN